MCARGKASVMVDLRTLRRHAGLTQETLGRRMFVSHSRISVIENRAPWDHMIRTVGAYADALGGRLELWVVLPDGSRVRLDPDPPKVDK